MKIRDEVKHTLWELLEVATVVGALFVLGTLAWALGKAATWMGWW